MKAYLTDRNVRRLTVLALFLGLLWYFRHLFLLLVFFIIFERTIGLLAGYLSRLTKIKFTWSVLIVVLLGFASVAGLMWFGISRFIQALPKLQQDAHDVIQTIQNSEIYEKVKHSGALAPEKIMERAKEHAGDVAVFLGVLAREALYVFIALVFAIVFLLEREELETWREKMAIDSVPRILLRNMGHVMDAIAITLKLQVIVAVVSALITLPVLIALRLPGIPALMTMQLVCGLIPVVGSPVSGAVLMVLAYTQKGPWGLVVFVVSTFILHKIESYYLTPRLTARHVKLPSFVIIVSLVLFEHIFGLVGLFLSFPCLYVAFKILEGWIDPEVEAREDAETTAMMRGALPMLSGLKLKDNVLRDLARFGVRLGSKFQGAGVAKGTKEPAHEPLPSVSSESTERPSDVPTHSEEDILALAAALKKVAVISDSIPPPPMPAEESSLPDVASETATETKPESESAVATKSEKTDSDKPAITKTEPASK